MATKTPAPHTNTGSDPARTRASAADVDQTTTVQTPLNPDDPALPGENEAAADRLLPYIPEKPVGIDEAGTHAWRAGTVKTLNAARSSKFDYDLGCLIAFLMAVLDRSHTPDPSYSAELEEKNLPKPNSNHPFAAVSAAFFGRNIKNNPRASRDINKDCKAWDGLRILLGDRPGGLRSFPRSREGIRELLKIALNNGGIAGLGAIEGSPEGGKASKPLTLSQERIREIVADRVRDRLAAKGVSLAVLSKHESASGTIEYGPLPDEHRLPPEPENLILSRMKVADDRIQFLSEIFQISHAIQENKTDRPVDANADPKDPATPMRLTSRQFVFRVDGCINISPILTSSSIVIRVRSSSELGIMGQVLHGDVVMQTYGRRRAERNILPTDTRGVWDFKLVDPGDDSEGVGRIMITTMAEAGKDKAEDLTDVGALLQQVKSGTDEFPLEVLDTAVVWQAMCDIDKFAFAEHAALGQEFSRVLSRGELPLTIQIDNEVMSVSADKFNRSLSTMNRNGKAKTIIAANDYANFLQAVGKMSDVVATPISLAIGQQDVVVFRFGTRLASYEVFIPALREKRRSNRSFQIMKPQLWPNDKPMMFEP